MKRRDLVRLVEHWLELAADEMHKGCYDASRAYFGAAFGLALELRPCLSGQTLLSDHPAWDWLVFVDSLRDVPPPHHLVWPS